MKKLLSVSAALCLILILSGCGSQAPAEREAPAANDYRTSPLYPDFVNDAIRTLPANVLMSVGQAKMASLAMARTIAANRARAEISRQMNTMVESQIIDHLQGNEMDPESVSGYQSIINDTLSKSTLTGSTVVTEDRDADGTIWCLVALDKARVVDEITRADAAAKLEVPAMAAFDALERMDAAFEKVKAEEAGRIAGE